MTLTFPCLVQPSKCVACLESAIVIDDETLKPFRHTLIQNAPRMRLMVIEQDNRRRDVKAYGRRCSIPIDCGKIREAITCEICDIRKRSGWAIRGDGDNDSTGKSFPDEPGGLPARSAGLGDGGCAGGFM